MKQWDEAVADDLVELNETLTEWEGYTIDENTSVGDLSEK